MITINTISENNKKVWISITGYRTLLVLVCLLEKGRTIDELVEILKNNEITSKAVSKDTVRITINTLKSAGCEIFRPAKSNGYRYEIYSHPFGLIISDENLKSLLLIRDKISNELSWEKVIILNKLYEKIISLTNKKSYIETVENSKPLNNVNLDILTEISNPNIKGKKIQVNYLSPKYGEEELDIIPHKIDFKNGKLYLFCYIYKYNQNSALNIERIKYVNTVSIADAEDVTESYEVTYKLFGNSFKCFSPQVNEEIIEKTEKFVIVRVKVSNEFWMTQRLLLFGNDFKIISPDFFREKLINKIKQIQKGYQE